MPLPAVLENLEGKPEYYKELYVQVDDKWVLDAEVEAHPRATNLKSALDKERKKIKTLETENKKFSDAGVDLERWVTLKDLDEEELRGFHAWREEKDKAGGNGNGDKPPLTDDEFNKRTDRMRKTHEAEKAQLEKKIADLASAFQKTTATFREDRKMTKLLEASTKGRVLAEAVEDVLNAGSKVFQVNEENELVALDKDGNVILGADLKPLEPYEWLMSKTTEKSHWWARNSGGGAGGGNGKGFDGIRTKADFHGDVEKQSEWMIKNPGKYLDLPDK